MGESVDVQVTDGVATIRLDRPPMNAISVQVQAELRAAAAVVTSTPEIRAAIIYGGEKVFAAGADVKELADKQYPEMALDSQAMHTSFTAVATIPKPVVAAVAGYALAGGLELALCADFRVCGESTKFGQPEILLGIIPGAGVEAGQDDVKPQRHRHLLTGRQQPSTTSPRTISRSALSQSGERRCAGHQRRMSARGTFRYRVYS
jgi:enoyl-CoA hydratase/carnithine racemase